MGRLVVITSGKGGAGKTSVTAGIGAALAARARRVLLVDACAGARCLDMYTGLAGEVLYDLGDVLTGRCTPSMAIHTVGSGLDLLAGPQRQEDFCDKGQIASLYQVLTQHYDFVLVDSPPGIGRGFELALSGAEEALVAVTPDEVCLRIAHDVAVKLTNLGVGNARMIINRFLPTLIWSGVLPNVDQMIDRTGLQLLGVVPEDGEIALSAAKGVLLRRGRAKLAFGRIAARLDGEEVPLANLKRL